MSVLQKLNNYSVVSVAGRLKALLLNLANGDITEFTPTVTVNGSTFAGTLAYANSYVSGGTCHVEIKYSGVTSNGAASPGISLGGLPEYSAVNKATTNILYTVGVTDTIVKGTVTAGGNALLVKDTSISAGELFISIDYPVGEAI